MGRDAVLRLRLYRVASQGPPFSPPCSWSDDRAVAEARRVQLLLKHGYAPIWIADVEIDPGSTLDARADASRIWDWVGGPSPNRRLRDAVHEEAATLAAHGFSWIVFDEPGEPGAEFVYVAGPPIAARLPD